MSEITKKVSAVVLTLALALSVTVTGFAAEPTVEDLQSQIAELQDLIAQLKNQLGGGTVVPSGDIPAACAGVSFNRNLSLGATGSDVKCLQAILNTDADTQVAVTGAGAKGQETEYFGGLTRAAVIKYQNKYASEVLTPLGLTAGTGIVGVQTRAKLNDYLKGGTPPPEPNGGGNGESNGQGTEGDLRAKVLPTPTNVDVAWGVSDVAVMAFEVEAKDSAIDIERIDIHLEGVDHDYRVWRSINHIAIYDGDNAVQGVSVNSSNAVKINPDTSRVRLSGMKINVPKNSKKTLTIKVSTDRPIDTGKVKVIIPSDGIRGVDSAKINQLAPGIDLSKTFTVEGTEKGGKIELKLNTKNPEEGIYVIDKEDSREVDLLIADFIVTKDNVEIEGIEVNLVATGVNEHEFDNVLAIKLYDGGTTLGSEAIATVNTSGTSIATSSVLFDDLGLKIKAGSTKTLTVKAEIEGGAATTTSLKASIAGADVTAISDNDATATTTSDVIGKTISFGTAAPKVEFKSESLTIDNSDTPLTATFNLKFTLTALGDDITVTSTDLVVLDLNLATTGTDLVVVTAATSTKITGVAVGGSDKIAKGETRTIEVSGSVVATSGTGIANTSVYVKQIKFNDGTEEQTISGKVLEDLVTRSVILRKDS